MAENTNNTTEQTDERPHQFLEKSKKSTEKEIQGEDVLTFCGATIILISILGGLVIWLVEDLDFWIALGAIFGVFSIGVFMCVVAKICRTLVEIRDNQLDK